MIRAIGRFLPQTITTQIMGIIIMSLVMGYAFTLAALLFTAYRPQSNAGPMDKVMQIGMIAQMASSAKSPEEVATILSAARRAGIEVDKVQMEELEYSPEAAQNIPLLTRFMLGKLEAAFPIVAVRDRVPVGETRDLIALKLDDTSALLFPSTPASELLPGLISRVVAFTLLIITLFVILLSVYAVRWITSPLSAIATAAYSFGRAPTDDDTLSETGPREIVQVARALNHMRKRIRALVEIRTRMLAAIGHDLRTPLTRLRLRADRVSDNGVREGMLQEIAKIDNMLSETLSYLRDDFRCEAVSLVDLPSVLQTICADFSDVGHNVFYDGPSRLSYPCRLGALTRALTNIVENGVKVGSAVVTDLRSLNGGGVQIDVSDDGPGIPHSLRSMVFEPFFKTDSARATAERSGFGLGLSIARDVVEGHGGQIDLVDRAPQGLTIRISLPRPSDARKQSSCETPVA
ncbi:Signal transduction histidine kinase [Rhizobiales bacterium GAS191]|nr:Signal transduction histidine kinase [Rhizobiales bacterium GAS113]SEE65680.1 Signal transduction histidine kinase [Rhizobiales bacterium GAS191]